MLAAGQRADAVIVEKFPIACSGTQAPRCIWINYDTVNKRMRAYAQIDDKAGDRRDYDVNVEMLTLSYRNGPTGLFTPISTATDLGDWSGDRDTAQTGLVACGVTGRQYLLTAEFYWRKYASGSEFISTGVFFCG